MRELLDRIDSDELTEWMAYGLVEPFGQKIDDLKTGVLAATIANAQGNKAVPSDFIPWLRPRGLLETAEDQEAAIDRILGVRR